MEKQKIKKLEQKINYTFKNKNLLINSMTHKTYAFEAKTPVEYNERLEFLGDSVLGFVTAKALYNTNKYFSEGELTRRRSLLVNNALLAEKAKELQIGKYLRLGKGEKLQNGSKNPTNLANALESLIGAIFLDSDIKKVTEFIKNTIFEKEMQI